MIDNYDVFDIVKSMRNGRTSINEEYNGNYEESTQDEVVTDDKYPGVFDQIKQALLQKIPNVKFGEDALTVNKEKSTITLKGSLPNLSGLTFIITTDISSTEGLYFTVEGLNLTSDALKTLQSLYGYSKVLISEWTANTVESTFK